MIYGVSSPRTTKRTTDMSKPAKPYPAFPLTPHARGWVKKYHGKVHWVAGPDCSPDEALRRWHRIAASIDFGSDRAFVPESDVTVGRLVNLYLTERQKDLQAGRITQRHLNDVVKTLKRFAVLCGNGQPVASLTPDHFATIARQITANKPSPHNVRRFGGAVGAMFRMAADEMWIPRPVAFGTRWRKLMRPPIQRVDRSISRDDCLKLLAAIGQCDNARESQRRLRATVLLALNGGYGPAEQAQLKTASVNLDTGFIEQRRGKTGVPHIVWLWPETVAAMREVIDPARQYVFVTRYGNPLVYTTDKCRQSPVAQQFARLAKSAGVRASLYSLRHTHRSVSGGAGDEAAADVLMGHSLPGMRAVYQSVSHERVRSVSEFVRGWLFNAPAHTE